MMDYIAFYVNLVRGGLPIEKVPQKYREKACEALSNI